jgi:hypothetical protein
MTRVRFVRDGDGEARDPGGTILPRRGNRRSGRALDFGRA